MRIQEVQKHVDPDPYSDPDPQHCYQHAEVRYELEKRFDFWKIWHLTNYMNIEIFRCCTFSKVFWLATFWYFGTKTLAMLQFLTANAKNAAFSHIMQKVKKYIFLPRSIIVGKNMNTEFFCCYTFFQGFWPTVFFLIFQNEQNWTEHKIMRFLLHIPYWFCQKNTLAMLQFLTIFAKNGAFSYMLQKVKNKFFLTRSIIDRSIPREIPVKV